MFGNYGKEYESMKTKEHLYFRSMHSWHNKSGLCKLAECFGMTKGPTSSCHFVCVNLCYILSLDNWPW